MRFSTPKQAPKTRKEMIAYLLNHPRYDTMNSCNNSTSYARCIKLSHLDIPHDKSDKAYELLGTENLWDEFLDHIIEEFNARHENRFQIFRNGRSGGYLVIIQGGEKSSGYKSFCKYCGQRNYQLATEENSRCGRCGENGRINYVKPPVKIYTQPGLSLDQDEDFEEWDTDEIRSRVELVMDFDKTVDNVISAFMQLVNEGEVEEYEYVVTKTRRIATL